MSNNHQRVQPAPSRRTSASKGAAPMETDPSPPAADPAPKWTEYPLVAAFDPNIKNNILKFAPSSSDKAVNLPGFVQPVKLNRKDPWMIRKKAEEEKKAIEMKLKGEVKDESDADVLNNLAAKELLAKGGRDESLVAPGSGSQPRTKAQPFKKKTKQVFIAADQTARMLRKEEYQSWLLEDGSETGSERWVGRYESAGAASGSSAEPSGSTSKSSTNKDAPGYVIFRLDPAQENFQVLPCHRFYRFTQRPNYDTLGADEAEAAYEKMQKPTTKEDVGRWFMRRRGAGAVASGSCSSGPPAQREGSVKPNTLDESKISLGPRPKKSQVEVVSNLNGRFGPFTAVHGANKNEADDEEKPRLGQEGDMDEFDFNEDFADDEEGAGNLNEEAMEEEELKELEERMKKEMMAAGRAGNEERAGKDNVDPDNLVSEKEDLTKEGKAVKKLLMRKDNDDVYESDDDVNPYASEDDDSDFEEVVPPPPPAPIVPSPTHSKAVPSSRAGTPGPSSLNPAVVPTQRNPSKLAPSKSSILKVDKLTAGPSSRSGTPALGTQSNGISPRSSATGLHLAIKPGSRANSPSTGNHPGKTPHSRAGSPAHGSKPGTPTSAVGTAAMTGMKRKYPGGPVMKDKRPNSSAPGSPSPDQGVGLITEQEVIELLRNRAISTKELLSHFKMRLKDERNKAIVFKIIKSVAQMMAGQLVLKDGL